MRINAWIVACIFVVAGLFPEGAFAGQQPISWSGSGWYFERGDNASIFTGSGVTLAGPYATKEACDAANSVNPNTMGYFCEFEGSDPNSGNSR